MPEYPALGDSADSPNGNRWLMLEEKSKYAYVVGFLQGMFQGHCFSTWGLTRNQEDGGAYSNATESYKDHWNRFVARVTYCQFCEGLDRLYADHRNRRIEIQNGMWIVMNQISGQPGATLESMIEAWRRKAARAAAPEPDPAPQHDPMPKL